jgi:D-glycero-beta-D-manno-heptose 1-phosphate adenylyltransferase
LVVVPKRARSKDKIVKELRSLAAILKGVRASGKSVVLTNGVFDILHVGHLRYLEDAKSRGDFLVVAVNDDKSAETIKGKGLPLVPVNERMELLSGLWVVDYVTTFADETADRLIEIIKPDLYAKGTDYNTKTLPERKTLKALNIKPIFVGDRKSHATSKLVQKIKKRKL